MRWWLGLPRVWFGFGQPVRRLEYAASGLLLVAVKFGLDSLIYTWGTGKRWPLTAYVQPMFEVRFDRSFVPGWTIWLLLLVTIPFLWIGASMTFRRCIDAGYPPTVGLLFFVPVLNYLVMLGLCLIGSRARDGSIGPRTEVRPPTGPPLRDWFLAVGAGIGVGGAMVLVSVLWLQAYGIALFVGAPFTMGALSAYLIHRRARASAKRTLVVTQLTLLVTSLCLLIFALEGAICVLMAYPLATGLAMIGGLLGQAIVRSVRSRPSLGVMLLWLPLLLAADVAVPRPPLRMVLSSIEIDAPVERVWPNVVGFSELPEPRRSIFKAGIAYPIGARIEGHGVGAVRYCEFSTGPFVEPITAWEKPTRLAFDVVAQPQPMDELSFWDHVHAPHLVDGFVSERGEFRLIPLAGGGTRLEGRTWYRLSIFPGAYWDLWSRAMVGSIHGRVLEHIKTLAENEG